MIFNNNTINVKYVVNNIIPEPPLITMRLIKINTNNYFNNFLDFILFYHSKICKKVLILFKIYFDNFVLKFIFYLGF